MHGPSWLQKVEVRITSVPEGPRRFPEALPEACPVIFICVAVPKGPGRFPEALPEACFASCHLTAVPESPGMFPEACPDVCARVAFLPPRRFWEALPEACFGQCAASLVFQTCVRAKYKCKPWKTPGSLQVIPIQAPIFLE